MFCLALAGRTRERKEIAAAIHRVQPGYGIGDFVGAFKLGAQLEVLVRRAARIIDA